MKKYFLKGLSLTKFLFLCYMSYILNFQLILATLINVVLDIKILKIIRINSENLQKTIYVPRVTDKKKLKPANSNINVSQ